MWIFLWHSPYVFAQTPDDPPHGSTEFPNPAKGKFIVGTADDPLAMFSRRPLTRFLIPEGGRFFDMANGEPHLGIDYTYPDDYLDGKPVWIYPIGPGYVTARASCPMCFVEGDELGRVNWRRPQYNYGFGDMVVIETPYNPQVSIYVMYAHMARDFVSLGDYVTPERVLGVAGATGYAQTIHLHMEIRYGEPGRFWNADFSEWDVRERWLATMYVDPALFVFPENHGGFLARLDEWLALQPASEEIP